MKTTKKPLGFSIIGGIIITSVILYLYTSYINCNQQFQKLPLHKIELKKLPLDKIEFQKLPLSKFEFQILNDKKIELDNRYQNNIELNTLPVIKYEYEILAEATNMQKAKTKYAIMRVFFATDRNRTHNDDPTNMFGNHEDQMTKISYGYCDISIPHNHRIGEIETPNIWRFEFSEDPEKHILLKKVIISPKHDFFNNLSSRVKASKGTNAFVFVHGFSVSFEDAAKRTAQISYDLAFDGAPVFYSWPSCGTKSGYTVDEQSIELTQLNLKNFLKDFFTYSEASNVYLIAHSMGNRALTRAVTALLTEEPTYRTRLREVILAAPDIDARVFKQDIAPSLAAAGRPVTLYASSKDKALVLSNQIHGYPRAGDSKNGVVVVPGVETIDASAVDTDDFWGHGYFADDRSVLGDIFNLIHNNLRADQRFGLHRVNSPTGIYWEFKH